MLCGAALAGVLFAGFSPHAFALDRSRTKPEVFTKCWDYSTVPDLASSPVTDRARIYFLNVEETLEAVDLEGAAKVWSTELGGNVISNLLAHEGALFVVTNTAESDTSGVRKATLRSLSKQTGVTNWSASLQTSERIALGMINGTVVAVDSAGSIVGVDSAKGSIEWTQKIGAATTADPHFLSNRIVLATATNQVLAVTPDGQTSILLKTEYTPTAILFESSDRYLIGDDRGNLVLSSAGGDAIWKFKHGGRLSFLLPYESEFLAASFDNFLYKLSRGGNVEWKTRLTGRIANRPIISGDTAVVSIVGDSSVYFIDLTNGKISNRVETGDENVAAIVTSAGASSLVVGGARGLAFYTRDKCPAK